MPFAPPRWGTARTDRPTDGLAIAEATRRLWRRELFGWQRHVLDVAHERDPRTGQHVYDTVVLVVGRRAGKSIGVLASDWAFAVHPQLWSPDLVKWRSAYTAQNSTAAIRRLMETWELFGEHATGPQRHTSRMLRGVNHASIELRWRHPNRRGELNPNRSRIAVFPPSRHSLRGDSFVNVKVDEVTTLSLEDGEALSDAVRPTLAEQHGQMWWLSNLALEDGGYLPALMERGRAAVEDGRTSGLAYFEWSAPEGSDIENPEVWRAAHPALGEVLSEARLRRELEEMGHTRFAAEYLNMAQAAGRLLPSETWAATRADEPAPTPGTAGVWLAVDTTPDRTRASLCATWPTPAGLCGGVLWTGRPPDLQDTVEQLRRTWRPAGVLFDPVVTTGVRGWKPITAVQYAEACRRLVDQVRAGTFTHRPDPALDAAAAGAVPRPMGDGWVWARRRSTVDISSLVAVTLAAYGSWSRSEPVLV